MINNQLTKRIPLAEAARRLGITNGWLRKLVLRGEVQATRSIPGLDRGRWLIAASEIERLQGMGSK